MDPGAPAHRPNFCPACGAPAVGAGPFCTTCGAPFAAPSAAPVSYGFALGCSTCGGEGRMLAQEQVFCAECRWLRPLAADYSLPVDAYLWALDAQAMNTLAGIGPLSAAARSLSGNFGRPWLEAAVNGVRLGPDQVPAIFNQAILAARIVGLPRMPEVYVSGDQMWDALTLGDETSAFVVLGSVLINFKGEDLLYVLGREMGHVAAGHALWKTVSQMLNGRAAGRTIMGEGIMQFLNPAKLVESAVDAPLMAWMRHAEITADRAGALCVGKPEVARRVATQWTLKTFPFYGQLNQAALDRQIAESDTGTVQAAEWTMSSTPFLSRRLKLMGEFFESEVFKGYWPLIQYWSQEVPRRAAQAKLSAEIESRRKPDEVRLNCVACGGAMVLPKASLEGKTEAKVRCPNPACGKVLELKPVPPNKAEVKRLADEASVRRITCVACEKPMEIPASALEGEGEAYIRCPNPDCRKVLTLKRRPAPEAPPPPPAAAAPPPPAPDAQRPPPDQLGD